jgi:hypothetical protein
MKRHARSDGKGTPPLPDSNKTLFRVIDLASEILDIDTDSLDVDNLVEAAWELCEAILALDKCLRDGGTLPDLWAHCSERGSLARGLFVRIATQVGVLTANPVADVYVELLLSKAKLDADERSLLLEGSWNLAERCLAAADAFLGALKPAEARAPATPRDAIYSCPECGSTDVELSFPVWVKANDIDDQKFWDLDCEAQPEKDSDMGWCPRCETNVLVSRKEVP